MQFSTVLLLSYFVKKIFSKITVLFTEFVAVHVASFNLTFSCRLIGTVVLQIVMVGNC